MDRDGDGRVTDARSWVGLPELNAGPVDHAWLDNGHGVLSCVAGHRHASDAIAVCPFYLRSDVVDTIPGHLRAGPELPEPVRYRWSRYFKITALIRPEHWHDFVASLPAHHGLRPCAWSVFSIQDPGRVEAGYDPRDALRRVLAKPAPGPTATLLERLLAELGDPGNEHGSLGITGSIAVSPERIDQAGDIDLLIYLPAAQRPDVDQALRGLGAHFLGDLSANGDARLDHYLQSRSTAPVYQPASRAVFWSRRRDVAWIGDQRIDLTWTEPRAVPVARLPYDLAPAGTFDGELHVTAVTDQFPVIVAVNGPESISDLHITARGLQESLLPGDRVAVTGNVHDHPNGQRFVSVDDAAGHRLDLATNGGTHQC